jgi:hypothetical protein
MRNPTIYFLITQARTEDLQRGARKIRPAIHHLDAPTTSDAAAAPSQQQ